MNIDLKINITKRPWGFYIKLFEESGVWVKRVEVNPESRLSLQKHEHRSEKWNIVVGEGVVLLDGKEIPVKTGTVIDVPVGAVHRIANTGTKPLIFIEVQLGDELDEEDIVRFEDDFGRV